MSIMERGGGIVSTVKATRACNFIQLRSKAEGFLKQMSAMGVTTVEGKSGYGLDKETELLQLRVMRSLNNDEHKRVDVVSTFSRCTCCACRIQRTDGRVRGLHYPRSDARSGS